jgi:DNA-directed RNA polymerase subunit beta'
MNREINFKALKLKIASPDEILDWSYGEIIKPETINYRTQRPEKDGLFSERIFGPTKDWECYCGKYRKVRYKGVKCDKCGVEVTRSSVRRERMGHINLSAPVVHPWFLRSVPSMISLAIDAPLIKLERVAYYAAYIVTSVDDEKRKTALEEIERELKAKKNLIKGETEKESDLEEAALLTKETLKNLRPGKILEEREFGSLGKRFGNVFTISSGGEGIRRVLEGIDLEKEIIVIDGMLKKTEEELAVKKLLRRLSLFKSMIRNSMRPEWMILTVLPVLPPDLRPMVALDGGRFATSDLNDLYRRVINRNNRLKKLLELKAPDVIVINEKRMLQEAVDALIDGSARIGTKPTMGVRRPLRSLADMLKGKQGRFRQNLLGKRVDYSGRSVIVVGPHLQHDECGLPKRMALELFRPFIVGEIIRKGLAHNIRNSNRLIDQAPPEVWEILEEVIKDRKVLLNRAPTLHRLNIQAFRPILTEGLAIQIPPFVTTAFNADFDGDQMAVHLPLSDEAQKEASELMLSSVNLLKPASGDAVVNPTQDIVLGCYYLTKLNPNAKGAGKIFSSNDEAKMAYDEGYITVNAPIRIGSGTAPETSYGRIKFGEALPEDYGFFNEPLNKKILAKLIGKLINKYGTYVTKGVLDRIKTLGFRYATHSGISWGMADLSVPKEKVGILKEADKKIALVEEHYMDGLLTDEERKARIIETWEAVKESIAKIIPKSISENNSVYMIIDSGARGSWGQPTQMMGMKGLVQNPNGEIIELPIKTSLKEGHTGLEYFISTHGSRKGLADTALKTAKAGYLTRRLVEVAHDAVIKEHDCKTKTGITVERSEGAEFGHGFAVRLASRTALEEIKIGRKTVAEAGEIITSAVAEEIEKSDISSVRLRSPITCKALYGICAKCYGSDLSSHNLIKIGEAVGIIAAQSIGEPGTQLVLRTKLSGGVAGKDITSGLPRVEELFEVRPPKGVATLSQVDGIVIKIEEKGLLKTIHIKVDASKKEKVIEYPVLRSNTIYTSVGAKVGAGDILTEGSVNVKELFKLKGKEEAYRYIIKEIQRIYISEGNQINNKHIEVIIRQMFARVKIVSSGDTIFTIGDVVDKSDFQSANAELKESGGEKAVGEEILLGLTRSALAAPGWLAAASFQETTRVLVKAATEGRIDYLRGLKENVIIGRLLPIGSMLKDSQEEVENISKKEGKED